MHQVFLDKPYLHPDFSKQFLMKLHWKIILKCLSLCEHYLFICTIIQGKHNKSSLKISLTALLGKIHLLLWKKIKPAHLLCEPSEMNCSLCLFLIKIGRWYLGFNDLVGVENECGHSNKNLKLWPIIFFNLEKFWV